MRIFLALSGFLNPSCLLNKTDIITNSKRKNEMSENKKAKRIAIVNQKGGAGKTTTSRMLVDHIVKSGKKVLVVDLDPQATLTTWLGVTQESLAGFKNEASNIFSKEQPEGAMSTRFGCDLIPASSSEMLERMERVMSGKELLLKKFLAKVDDQYDYIIVDTAGAMVSLTKSAIVACPTLVVPMQTAAVDAEGTQGFFRQVVEVVEIFNCKIEELFIVPTMYNKKQTGDKVALADMQSATASFLNSLYGFDGASILVTEPIPQNSSIKEALSLGEPGGVSPQDSLKDKYKNDVVAVINSVCNNISGV